MPDLSCCRFVWFFFLSLFFGSSKKKRKKKDYSFLHASRQRDGTPDAATGSTQNTFLPSVFLLISPFFLELLPWMEPSWQIWKVLLIWSCRVRKSCSRGIHSVAAIEANIFGVSITTTQSIGTACRALTPGPFLLRLQYLMITRLKACNDTNKLVGDQWPWHQHPRNPTNFSGTCCHVNLHGLMDWYLWLGLKTRVWPALTVANRATTKLAFTLIFLWHMTASQLFPPPHKSVTTLELFTPWILEIYLHFLLLSSHTVCMYVVTWKLSLWLYSPWSLLLAVKVLNQAKFEASVRAYGSGTGKITNRWPSPYVMVCGVFLFVSLFEHFWHPLKWFALVAAAAGLPPIILKSIAAARRFSLDINILMLIAGKELPMVHRSINLNCFFLLEIIK